MIEFLKSNIIPIAAFLISLATFFITFANFWRNRAKIECIQPYGVSAHIIKPDRINTETPDVYWQSDFRVIMDIIITNKSALPISIIEFKLNNRFKFNSYSRPGTEYPVTTQSAKQVHNNVTFYGAEERKLEFQISDKWLQPIIDIPPYTSLRGHLFFHANDTNDLNIGENTLEIVTSRKNFSFQVKLFNKLDSVIPLPNEVREVREANLF
ncbi:hypothetical protein COM07_25775 [Bacillus toyonensis]|uniref:hypothetical protein n=1 Tax=Bacillus toyonensis TaxID=155322 RepID=UPI000BF3008C|nr:hypothetical protein [Bacillus toyonensis]PGB34872.1 hypothetical protein COM07_25775 [Bacillus toyonensis]PHF07219.1 hypothetical protein COF83_31010 [Bacillus toyonensis]PHF43004.1 hypothetical protein COI39_20225 [Bacillus toyonensis]